MSYRWPFSPKNSVQKEREKAARVERAQVRALRDCNEREDKIKYGSPIVSKFVAEEGIGSIEATSSPSIESESSRKSIVYDQSVITIETDVQLNPSIESVELNSESVVQSPLLKFIEPLNRERRVSSSGSSQGFGISHIFVREFVYQNFLHLEEY